MAQMFDRLNSRHTSFIEQQPVFFVATAASDGRINLSPKGLDSMRILDDQRLLWMNLTGSGNETAAHLSELNRITLMWCAFEGPPLILRVYGKATVLHPRDARFEDYRKMFKDNRAARQFFEISIESVQTSCGYAVPLMSFEGERDILSNWSDKKSDEEIQTYWRERNQTSIDGKPTHIIPSIES